MSKRKEEEKRILAEMDEAMRELSGEIQEPQTDEQPSAPSQKLYCRRCKTELTANGVCPVCGYRVYMPMDEQKRKKIRFIVATACIVGFLILFFLMK